MELSNGGLGQFFVNPNGDRWKETLHALQAVGALRLAVLFEEALTVFPNNTPSTVQETRSRQLATGGKAAADLLERLTNEYHVLQAESVNDCLYKKLTAFAIKQMAGESTE